MDLQLEKRLRLHLQQRSYYLCVALDLLPRKRLTFDIHWEELTAAPRAEHLGWVGVPCLEQRHCPTPTAEAGHWRPARRVVHRAKEGAIRQAHVSTAHPELPIATGL